MNGVAQHSLDPGMRETATNPNMLVKQGIERRIFRRRFIDGRFRWKKFDCEGRLDPQKVSKKYR